MKHFSFQLVDLGRILTNIDKARYLNAHSNRTPAGEVDNDDPEFLLNRILTYFNIGTKVNDGCVVGLFYGVSETIKNRLEDYKSSREQEKINGTNILEEFDNFKFGDIWADQGIHLIGVSTENRVPTLFTLPEPYNITDFLYQGFSTQLEDINVDNDIFETKTAKYVNAALNAIKESDMSNEDKYYITNMISYLFSCLPLNTAELNHSNNVFIDTFDETFISKIGYAYPNELQNEDLIKCLKQARALEGYNTPAGEFNYPNFTIWALLVSVGEEGVNDDCCLENITIGDNVTYETEVSYPIENVQVEITPLPRNRCKVNYTITANPGNNGKLEFKITY